MNSKLPTISFGIVVACTFSDNLSRNSCISNAYCAINPIFFFIFSSNHREALKTLFFCTGADRKNMLLVEDVELEISTTLKNKCIMTFSVLQHFEAPYSNLPTPMRCTADDYIQSCMGGKCKTKRRTKNSCVQQCSSLFRICLLVECGQVSFTLPLQIKLKGGRQVISP